MVYAGGVRRVAAGDGVGDAVGEFTAAYNALRFGGHAEPAARLSTLLDEIVGTR